MGINTLRLVSYSRGVAYLFFVKTDMKDRTHSFSVEEATKYGIEKAILLEHIRFWCDKVKANNKGIHQHTDGKNYHWTYNSGDAFEKLFPYMKRRTISMHLQQMEESGIIFSGIFNKNKYDKTKWYTTNAHSIGENCQSSGEYCQSRDENCQPIPASITASITASVEMDTVGIPNGNQRLPQDRLGKDRKKESFFPSEREPIEMRPGDLERLEAIKTASDYSSDGRSPRVRLAEKRAIEKEAGLRKTPELVRFVFKAGWDFRTAFKEAKGYEYEGVVILDEVVRTLLEWHNRGRTTEDIQRLLKAFFRSKKAKELTVTPTSCFSEHTYQSFAQGTLK